MNGENRPLVIDEPVEVQDFRKIADEVEEYIKLTFKLATLKFKFSVG